jgi:hypothetical protein
VEDKSEVENAYLLLRNMIYNNRLRTEGKTCT